jgi:hypothetical protein
MLHVMAPVTSWEGIESDRPARPHLLRRSSSELSSGLYMAVLCSLPCYIASGRRDLNPRPFSDLGLQWSTRMDCCGSGGGGRPAKNHA